jgi:hypothetical protein
MPTHSSSAFILCSYGRTTSTRLVDLPLDSHPLRHQPQALDLEGPISEEEVLAGVSLKERSGPWVSWVPL